jgi:hypothetical protein
MPHYTFAFGSVLEPAQVIEVLADDNAARLHADIVAEEFNRNRDQPVAVLVLDDRGRLVHRATPRIISKNADASAPLTRFSRSEIRSFR